MRHNRRDFLKRAGIGAAGATLLPACGSDPGSAGAAVPSERTGAAVTKDWPSDPAWQQVKYGAWGGPGVPVGPGPMDDVLVKDHAPRSTLVVAQTDVPKPRVPVIDVHAHDYPGREEGTTHEEAVDAWVRTHDEVGVETTVVLTGATGEAFDRLADLYLTRHPDRFQLYCGVEQDGIDQPDYPERAARELERCYRMGARGVGEITDKGYGITRDPDLAPEARLHHDDDRLDPLWTACAELNMPVNVHIADHPSAWEPPDVFQERTPIYQQFNQHGEDCLSYEQLVERLPRLLEKHPETTFIACHLANQGNDLRRIGETLDRYPNLYLDVSARDYEVGRQPRSAPAFLTKYVDRVLFGTDMGMQKTMYQSWWRLLESTDEHMPGRTGWHYYGLALPEPVLQALYRGNAERLLNWETV